MITILWSLFFFQSVTALAGGLGCLKCHESHYEEKGICIDCHRGNPGTDRILIAHHDLIDAKYAHFTMEGSPVSQRGLALIKISGCRRCHVLDAKGNPFASNLDRAFGAVRPQTLFDAIQTPVFFMPNFYFKEAHIITLVNAILAEATRAAPDGGETPLVIHFEDDKQSEEKVFGQHCGCCHKVLTTHFGGLGKGDIGPNLSGLFSKHYPRTQGDKASWSSKALKDWLDNPRQISKNAQMPPVKLSPEAFPQLLDLLGAQTLTPHGKRLGKN